MNPAKPAGRIAYVRRSSHLEFAERSPRAKTVTIKGGVASLYLLLYAS